MAKIPEADARIFRNIFICKKCKSRIRASSMKVTQGKIKCRKCGSRALRPVRKK
ncbi:50S ribosomal protein L40e [Candidatus Woesearchaeota archaeon]|nr:50S ribosomal protein L40e [Candidatus Woesearchaeota archaeon]